jgi:divalent metal cation (Fe/Co/Zn/Cd) transporter
MTATGAGAERSLQVRRGLHLNAATIVYNSLEGIVSIWAAVAAGSVVLLGFGVDSAIEVAASLAALWRLRADVDPARRERVEHASLRIVGLSFLALGAFVTYDAIETLSARVAPSPSIVGVAVTAASLMVMPLLAGAKRRVARALGSGALTSEAQQTMVCTYLSAIALAGLGLNAALGWWWSDPVGGLVMVPFIIREGVDALRGRTSCGDECCK